MATVDDFRKWFERDVSPRYANWDNFVEIDEQSETEISIHIYTDINVFHIVAHNPSLQKYPTKEKTVPYVWVEDWWKNEPYEERMDNGHLGCTVATRKPRAGEKYARGNDLSDGHLSEDTWRSIMGDIISYELVHIHRPKSKKMQRERLSEEGA